MPQQPLPADFAHLRRARLALALGHNEEAASSFAAALGDRAGTPADHFDFGVLLHGLGRLSEAAEQFARSTRFDDAHADAFLNLARTRIKLGESRQAVAAFSESLRRGAGLDARSDRLLALNYVPELTEGFVAEEHFREGAAFGRELRGRGDFEPLRAESATMPLRIAILSPDLRSHPVGWYLRPLLPRLRALGLEILAYSSTSSPDDVTAELRTSCSHWRDCRDLPDADVESIVLRDRPHVLLDMSGHTARNRMSLVARRLAPVQIQWIGYANTTGVPSVDYTIGDRFETPSESHRFFSESILTMPGAYVCYAPPSELGPTGPLPCLANDFVTYGSLNNPSKIDDSVLEAWAEILRSVPRSRLLLRYMQYADPMLRARYHSFFDARGVSPSRVEMIAGGSPAEAMQTYRRIDVALDTFPYSGCTTTCEALACGVPVVAMPGRGFAGRHSVSFLHAAEMSEWVAVDRASYVDRAIAAGADRTRLADLRRWLPEMLGGTPLGDAESFSRNFRLAVMVAVEQWRSGQPASSAVVR